MFRLIALIICITLPTALSAETASDSMSSEVELELDEQRSHPFWGTVDRLSGEGVVIWDAACCKVCRKGKACGDSCISRSYQCHKGRGCACDG